MWQAVIITAIKSQCLAKWMGACLTGLHSTHAHYCWWLLTLLHMNDSFLVLIPVWLFSPWSCPLQESSKAIKVWLLLKKWKSRDTSSFMATEQVSLWNLILSGHSWNNLSENQNPIIVASDNLNLSDNNVRMRILIKLTKWSCIPHSFAQVMMCIILMTADTQTTFSELHFSELLVYLVYCLQILSWKLAFFCLFFFFNSISYSNYI